MNSIYVIAIFMPESLLTKKSRDFSILLAGIVGIWLYRMNDNQFMQDLRNGASETDFV